jgi:L-asparagine transporter-like permease
VYVTSISLVGSLWTWALIVIAHLGYRKAVATGVARAVPYRMPGSPYTNWFVVAFLVLVAVLLSLDEGTRIALYVAALSLPKRSWRSIEWREGTAEPLSSRFARVRVRAAHRDYTR